MKDQIVVSLLLWDGHGGVRQGRS